jgi:NDP-sugar pyrophosphorylase family protein
VDLDRLIGFHKRQGAVATIATKDLSELTGIYVIEPQIFKYIPNGFSMLESNIFPKLIEEEKAAIYPTL